MIAACPSCSNSGHTVSLVTTRAIACACSPSITQADWIGDSFAVGVTGAVLQAVKLAAHTMAASSNNDWRNGWQNRGDLMMGAELVRKNDEKNGENTEKS
jgi:hypothetical protein